MHNGLIMDLAILLLLIILIAALLPVWPYSKKWGYRPSGAVGALLVILLFLFVFFRPGA
ncbi:hypothetical protein Loa_00339 [Legionella oakridgensis ATCC 33761 = DSM 21215]|uniref:DUF3309 domain-containing protein n=3 Tax=Legionella oakridgensis TaxID=29423 RepID=W0B5X9_9GAMM|nr:hypothetical protein Loa_00339 [Legionella oakridgensis ATCC 33761 = DSM 21215]ETO94303.1 hypothetical protein LOR_8c00620 [Legionella oakridgensis RV-2-2007]KTD43781.1 hypothetical protein Loak_0331 [Legionella oakridgensis]STY15859.1 Protein of uncharacterised function (DUF3309) [Legionella longbeachae]